MVQLRVVVVCSLITGCAPNLRNQPPQDALAATPRAGPQDVPVRPQTEAEGLTLVCAAPTKVLQNQPGPFDMRPITDWIAANVSNPEAQALVWGHTSWSLAQRAQKLSARAKELRIADCPLSVLLESSARVEPAAPEQIEQATQPPGNSPPDGAPGLTDEQRNLIERVLQTSDMRSDSDNSVKGSLPGGSLWTSDIQRTIRGHYARLRRCYESTLARHPRVEGRLTVRIAIAPDGTVAGVHVVSNNTHSASLATCVKAVARSWRFPEPDGGGFVFVAYPLVFEAR